MELSFVKVSPTQNMTILVETPVPRASHREVAARLMAYDSVHAEQVGFVEGADPPALARLQMMGGEFCGNATMSLASLLVSRKNLPVGAVEEVALESSGADGVVRCRVEVLRDGFRGTVNIPPPERVEQRELSFDGVAYPVACVYFTGITHIVLNRDLIPRDARAFAQGALADWRERLPGDACGLILMERQPLRIQPLVYVHSTGSAVWERSCGSGTAAVGAVLALERGETVTADIAQPGGIVSVTSRLEQGTVVENAISGEVRIVAFGTAIL